MSISENCKVFTNELYSGKILRNFYDLWRTNSFCDLEVTCDGNTFKAHRALLASSSSYFRAMFLTGMKESQSQKLNLSNISSYSFNILLEFVYTGQIVLTESTVQEILVASDMLGFSEVIDACTEFLKAALHPSNAIGIFRLAESHSCEALKIHSQTHIYRNFPQIIEEDEFLETPKDVLQQFLESEKLKVDSEYQVLQAALNWIQYSLPTRRPYVFQILKTVRLALIPPRLLEHCIQNIEDPSIRIALRSLQQNLLSKKGSLVSLLTQPRKGAKKHIYVIGGSRRQLGNGWKQISESTLNAVECFDTFKNTWTTVAPLNIGRITPGVATLEGLIYVVGGEQESKILADGEVYSPQENSWTSIPPMIIPRCSFGLTTWENELTNESFIYAFGGWVGEGMGGSIERYDPYANEWKMIGDLEEPRFGMGCFSHNGLIYIIGGCTLTHRHVKDLSSYDPFSREWKKLAPMRISRSQMGFAVLNSYLYVMGGSSKHSGVLQSVERYSFEKDEWEDVASLNVGRANPSCHAVDGKIFCIGGDHSHESNFFRAQVTLCNVEVYDALINKWEEAYSLLESRSEAGITVL